MVGSVVGAFSSSSSGNKAAKAQVKAAQIASDTEKYFYDTTRSDEAPGRQVGQGALYKLADMYGVPRPVSGAPVAGSSGTGATSVTPTLPPIQGSGKGGFVPTGYMPDGIGDGKNTLIPIPSGQPGSQVNPVDMTAGYDGFQASPGYQFRLSEGVKAAEHSASARGLLGSGAAMKAVQTYGEGLASSEYENYANRLAALAGIGQSATATTAAAGTNAANQISQNQINAGNARASAYATTGTAINNGIKNAYGNITNLAALGGF